MRDLEYYARFINSLSGLIDDAELANYDADGLEHLREALEFFQSDYRIRKQPSVTPAEGDPGAR